MRLLALIALCTLFASGQQKRVAEVSTTAAPVIEILLEDRTALRELQLQWDELELENLRKAIDIERNHQKQQQIMDQLKVLVIKYAQKKQINLDAYELDPKDLKFSKRK